MSATPPPDMSARVAAMLTAASRSPAAKGSPTIIVTTAPIVPSKPVAIVTTSPNKTAANVTATPIATTPIVQINTPSLRNFSLLPSTASLALFGKPVAPLKLLSTMPAPSPTVVATTGKHHSAMPNNAGLGYQDPSYKKAKTLLLKTQAVTEDEEFCLRCKIPGCLGLAHCVFESNTFFAGK